MTKNEYSEDFNSRIEGIISLINSYDLPEDKLSVLVKNNVVLKEITDNLYNRVKFKGKYKIELNRKTENLIMDLNRFLRDSDEVDDSNLYESYIKSRKLNIRLT